MVQFVLYHYFQMVDCDEMQSEPKIVYFIAKTSEFGFFWINKFKKKNIIFVYIIILHKLETDLLEEKGKCLDF